MKQCSRCGQTYSDPDINFCLNDGELLHYLSDDPPKTIVSSDPRPFADESPTVVMNQARVTNQNNWQPSAPPVQWQSQPLQFAQYPAYVSPNQTLAIVSLVLGLGSMTIGWCCSLGVLLSPAALIAGFIALSQIKKNPQTYSGRGMAIGGIVLAGIFLALYILFILIYGIGLFLGGIS